MSYIVRQLDAAGHVRLFIATNHHDSIKKQSRQDRRYLGVLDKVAKELLLGSRCAEPDAEIIQLLQAKGIQYCGRKAGLPGPKRKDGKPKHSKNNYIDQDSLQKCQITHGKADAFCQLAQISGLTKALTDAFGEKIGKQLLVLAMHQASEEEAMYLADEWIEDIGIKTSLSSATISRLMASIGNDFYRIDQFFQNWITACGKPSVLIHDTTSISTYADILDLSEWGYNRDGDELPQVNLALVVARESRLPLWYRIIPGSIPDVATLRLTCDMLQKLGLNSFSFSLDRGYYSNANLSEMIQSKLGFTIGVPLFNKQAKVLIQKNRTALTAIKRSFLYGESRLRHVDGKFTITHSDSSKTELPAHLYFDPARREQAAKRIETAVLQLEEKASKLSFQHRKEYFAWIFDNAGKLSKYFSVLSNGEGWEIIRKSNALAKAMNDFGITLIITDNVDCNRDTTLSDYRCRDIAEKVFDTYKNGTDSYRLRSGNPDCVQGRLFVAFLAVTLRALIESKLRTANLLKSYSVSEALMHLGKIKRIQFPTGKSFQLEIPKKSRLIAEALDLPTIHSTKSKFAKSN